MSTYVLVHGAFLGGWCWRRVKHRLRGYGHTVYSPTLTGLGDLDQLLAPDVGLQAHIQDVVSVIRDEKINDAVLVGHSYGGMVITGVMETTRPCIKHMVYIDAFVPKTSQALCEQFSPKNWEDIQKRVQETGDGWRWELGDPEREMHYWGITAYSDLNWVLPRLRPQSIKTATEPVLLSGSEAMEPKKTYIYCSNDRPNGTYHGTEKRLRNDPNWKFHDIPAGHAAIITHPELISALLLSVV